MSDSKNKKEAYQIVLDDLMLCDLFRGRYDAKHGASEHYMYGICTVMEAIACRISEKTGDAFSDIFILNMIKSEEKYEAMSKHTETHDLRTETHGVCSDTISRQAAMDALKENTVEMGGDDWCEIGVHKDDIEAIINALPSVNNSGHWIEDAETFYKAVNEYGGGVDENTPYFTDDIACSKCLAKFSVIDNETERFDFCPNCGALMEGADDE